MDRAASFFQIDGFPVASAEPWIQFKVDTIREYLANFVWEVKSKYDEVIFVDLFSGNGFYSIGAEHQVLPGSTMMALSQDLPIHRYILCEKDPDHLKTLKIRVNKYFKGRNVILLEGHPDQLVERFKLYIPASKNGYRVAVICVVDPFSFDLSFNTIDSLAGLKCSFIIPYNLVLNERMNYEYYLVEEREKIKKFLGGYKDITRLEKDINSNEQFYKRLIKVYEQNLQELGLAGSTSVHKMDSGLMELTTFHVGFYSKLISTQDVIERVEVKRNSQIELF